MRLLSLTALVFGVLAPVHAQAKATAGDTLSRSLDLLGGESLAGREAGTEGCRRAAAFLAEGLKEAGFEGLGDDGGYLLSYPAERVVYPEAPKLLFTKRDGSVEEARYGVDFNLVVRGRVASTEPLPIVRVGKEFELPSEASPDAALFLRATAAEREEWLLTKGQGDGSGWGLDLRLGTSEERGKPKGPPPARLVYEPEEEGCEIVYLRGAVRENLLWKGYTAVQLVFDEEREAVRESDVVGLLRGADPKLAQEVVLLQAPYDGDGSARDADGGASAAALLEVARSLAAAPRAPRSLAVLFTTGTPKARVGLSHFLAHPPLELTRVRVALCLAGLGHPGAEMGSPPSVWITGLRSSLASALRAAGLPVSAPPKKEFARPLRTSAVPFSRIGLPAERVSAPYTLEGQKGKGARLGPVDRAYLEFAAKTLTDAVARLLDGSVELPAREGAHPGSH